MSQVLNVNVLNHHNKSITNAFAFIHITKTKMDNVFVSAICILISITNPLVQNIVIFALLDVLATKKGVIHAKILHSE